MIVFVQMTGEEQIGAESRRIGREIAQWNVQISATILEGGNLSGRMRVRVALSTADETIQLHINS